MTDKPWKALPVWDFGSNSESAYAEGVIKDQDGNVLIKTTGGLLDLGHSEVCGTFEKCQAAHVLEANITLKFFKEHPWDSFRGEVMDALYEATNHAERAYMDGKKAKKIQPDTGQKAK
jgi:hypothetical protein